MPKKHSNKVQAWQYAIKARMMALWLNIHSPIPTSWGYVYFMFFYAIIPAFIACCVVCCVHG